MEIQKKVALPDELFEHLDHLGLIINLAVIGEFPVHILIDLSSPLEDGWKVGPGYNNEVPPLQNHISIEIRSQKSSGLIPLNTAYEKKGLARVMSVNPVDMELVFTAFIKNRVGLLGQNRCSPQ